MNTIAVVGAGSGLGLSIAKRFGTEGFNVALISRTQTKLDDLVEKLGVQGITAAGFTADVTDPPTLTTAIEHAEQRFGSIDVLEYSPAPAGPAADALAPITASEVTIDTIRPHVEYYLYGGITAVHAALPGMRMRGGGTLMVTTGASSGAVVHPPFGNVAAASAALRNWVINLNAELNPENIYAVHIAIAAWIGGGGPASQPDTIADTYWDLFTQRNEAEQLYVDPDMKL